MEADMKIEIMVHDPPRVSEIIATSLDFCVCRTDDQTVLKCPHGEQNPCTGVECWLDVEAKIYGILGEHERVIGFEAGDLQQKSSRRENGLSTAVDS